MMHNKEKMEQAIKKAIEGGYDTEKVASFMIDEEYWCDPLFWQCLGKAEGWEDADDWEEANEKEMVEGILALEETAGLDVKTPAIIPRFGPHWWFITDSWQYHWHCFIDHLAKGKDAESFFKELLNHNGK